MPPRSRNTDADADVTAPDADAAPGPKADEPKADEPKADARKSDGESKSSSSGTEYLNTTSGPVVYDKAGHSVGGGEWTPAVNLDAVGKTARQAGYLKPRSAL